MSGWKIEMDVRLFRCEVSNPEHRDEQTDEETDVLTDRDLGRTDERAFKSIWHRKQRWQKVSQEANLAHKINDIKA